MKYLLDTNICIYLLRGKFHMDEMILKHGEENCYISEITVAELKYGDELGRQKGIGYREQALDEMINTFRVLPIYDILDLYAKEKARLRLAGTPAEDDFDLLIGCTSVYHKMVMVTENTDDFKRIKDIRLENWVNKD